MQSKNDAELQQKITYEITLCSGFKPDQVGVSVEKGVVTLYGVTESYSQKRCAKLAAEKVKGVQVIGESIEVLLPDSSIRSDEEIVKEAHDAISRNVNVSDKQIKIMVNDGWITLEGQVDEKDQKTAAERAVEGITGIYGVDNVIKVRNINPPIQNAFTRPLPSSLARSQ